MTKKEIARLKRIEMAAARVVEMRRLLSFYAELESLAPEQRATDQEDEEYRKHLRAQAIAAMRELESCVTGEPRN